MQESCYDAALYLRRFLRFLFLLALDLIEILEGLNMNDVFDISVENLIFKTHFVITSYHLANRSPISIIALYSNLTLL